MNHVIRRCALTQYSAQKDWQKQDCVIARFFVLFHSRKIWTIYEIVLAHENWLICLQSRTDMYIINQIMLCCVVLCHRPMSCHVMSCHVMPCHVMLCHCMSYCLCDLMLFHVIMSCHESWQVMSWHNEMWWNVDSSELVQSYLLKLIWQIIITLLWAITVYHFESF